MKIPFKKMSGVTLVELMIVIVIVAILGSLATGSYRSYMLRANRTDGRTAILRVRAAEEKFFLQNNAYTSSLTASPPTGLGIPATSESGKYAITLAATQTTYTATATATGGQASDTAACRVLTINQDGTRTPADSTGCWK